MWWEENEKDGAGEQGGGFSGGREGPHTASPSTFPEDASDTGFPSPWRGGRITETLGLATTYLPWERGEGSRDVAVPEA